MQLLRTQDLDRNTPQILVFYSDSIDSLDGRKLPERLFEVISLIPKPLLAIELLPVKVGLRPQVIELMVFNFLFDPPVFWKKNCLNRKKQCRQSKEEEKDDH